MNAGRMTTVELVALHREIAWRDKKIAELEKQLTECRRLLATGMCLWCSGEFCVDPLLSDHCENPYHIEAFEALKGKP
jgi:hypothetical protein